MDKKREKRIRNAMEVSRLSSLNRDKLLSLIPETYEASFFTWQELLASDAEHFTPLKMANERNMLYAICGIDHVELWYNVINAANKLGLAESGDHLVDRLTGKHHKATQLFTDYELNEYAQRIHLDQHGTFLMFTSQFPIKCTTATGHDEMVTLPPANASVKIGFSAHFRQLPETIAALRSALAYYLRGVYHKHVHYAVLRKILKEILHDNFSVVELLHCWPDAADICERTLARNEQGSYVKHALSLLSREGMIDMDKLYGFQSEDALKAFFSEFLTPVVMEKYVLREQIGQIHFPAAVLSETDRNTTLSDHIREQVRRTFRSCNAIGAEKSGLLSASYLNQFNNDLENQ